MNAHAPPIATEALVASAKLAKEPTKVNYLWLHRSPITLELLAHKSGAWRLLSLISIRLRYSHSESALNTHGLAVGEAFIGRGDHQVCGLSEKQYRTAVKHLQKWKIADFRVIKGVGTIARLLNRNVFDPLTAFELGQRKGQPFSEVKSEQKGQPTGQPRANQGPLTDNETKKERNNDDSKAWGNSLASEQTSNAASSFSVFECYQNHIKWPEYAAWCKRRPNGSPTAKGFDTWLSKQKPEWRNKVKSVAEEEGYTLNGKFLTKEEATRRVISDSSLYDKFKPAVRRHGEITLTDNARDR